jgi:hypothetical protein
MSKLVPPEKKLLIGKLELISIKKEKATSDIVANKTLS